MKWFLSALLVLVFALTGCSTPSRELQYSGEGWELAVTANNEALDLSDVEALCKQFTNVRANVWTTESDKYQLAILEMNQFAVAQYVTDGKLYAFSADSLKYLLQGLSQLYDAAELVSSEPTVYISNAQDVTNVADDGWGIHHIDGQDLPWPSECTTYMTGWETDDASFEIAPYTEMEESEDALKSMQDKILASNVEGFKMWYFQDSVYQGLAWLLDNHYYISLAKYSATGSWYLTFANQENIIYARETADRYDMGYGMRQLLNSQPIFMT